MSVNRPTNVKQKEQDVNQKLQLYGILSAFSNGKAPSNKQIDIALNSALASKPLANPSAKLSEEGRALVGDLRNVIEQAKVLLLTKNQDNLLQDFIWQAQQVSGGNAALPGAPVDKATAQQHGNQALDGLKTLGTLILSNGQFRKLLNDATILFRDMAGDAASQAANRINPSEDSLSQIDKPASDNTWHEVPDLSPANLRAQAKDQVNKQKPFGSSDVKNAASNTVDAVQQGQNPVAAAQSNAQDLNSTANSNVSEETKNKAQDAANTASAKTKNYLGSKMPKDRREQTIWRLKKMVVEVQNHPDYQQAIETLLSLAETYTGHSRDLAQQSKGAVKDTHEDSALRTVENNLKTLLERFANNTSADDLIESINQVYHDAEKDPELRTWFKSVDAYIRKCLQQTGFIMEDKANDEWSQLQQKGEFLLRERYRDHTDRVLDEFKFFGQQFDEDPLNKKFATSMDKLFNDIGHDVNGKAVFKTHLVKDVSEVIIPGIFENVRYVPIPRIEYTDPQVDAIIENLVLEGDNLAPNSFEFQTDNYFRWGRKSNSSGLKQKFMVSVSGIQADLKDVSYYVKRKQGFPSLSDIGVMDIFLGGTGFSFKLAMETADSKDRANFFKVSKVDVNVKHFTIKLKQSKHKLLFNLFKPLMFAILRPAIGKALEKVIKDQVTAADAKLYAVHLEAQKAIQAAAEDPENAPNLFNQYVTAAKTNLIQKKEKAEAIAADRKAKVAVTRDDSILPNIKLPGGISTKATEYKTLAGQGDNWESPVFSIGSAAESRDLPSLAPITRKPHNAAAGGIRGQQNIGGPSGTAGFDNEVNQAFSTSSSNQFGTSSSNQFGTSGTNQFGLKGDGLSNGAGVTGTTLGAGTAQ